MEFHLNPVDIRQQGFENLPAMRAQFEGSESLMLSKRNQHCRSLDGGDCLRAVSERWLGPRKQRDHEGMHLSYRV
jgi:hypothetical protein